MRQSAFLNISFEPQLAQLIDMKEVNVFLESFE